MIIANMATFPGRKASLLDCLNRILPQIDELNLCLNEYEEIPLFLKNPKINAFVPEKDYRDVGKFVVGNFRDSDDIFYMDDDILYPEDYVERLRFVRGYYKELNPVVGVHGVIYPDVYDGSVGSRVVFSFRKTLSGPRVVNQLGTGTVHCKGFQAPTLEFMAGSERYVDVRYALHSKLRNWPLICVERTDDWLREVEHEASIFTSFTSAWPSSVVKECCAIAGYSNLDPFHVFRVESLACRSHS